MLFAGGSVTAATTLLTVAAIVAVAAAVVAAVVVVVLVVIFIIILCVGVHTQFIHARPFFFTILTGTLESWAIDFLHHFHKNIVVSAKYY